MRFLYTAFSRTQLSSQSGSQTITRGYWAFPTNCLLNSLGSIQLELPFSALTASNLQSQHCPTTYSFTAESTETSGVKYLVQGYNTVPGQDSNPRPFDHEPDVLTTRPPCLRWLSVGMSIEDLQSNLSTKDTKGIEKKCPLGQVSFIQRSII